MNLTGNNLLYVKDRSFRIQPDPGEYIFAI